MSRPIKFRARWMDTKKVVEDFMEEYLIEALNDDNFIVEQFTSLHDKNGKEIWEGDVVAYLECNCLIRWSDILARYVMDYKDVKGRFDVNEEVSCCMQVLGNIHENPELLK